MPEVDSSGAFQLAEKLRKTVESTVFKSGEAELPITISVGVATLGAEEGVKAFIDTADQALYKSKEKAAAFARHRWSGLNLLPSKLSPEVALRTTPKSIYLACSCT